jgi:hypothetical protein
VQVHHNSPHPATLGALAYTHGTHIHLGPGHERELPHEAWHVVQQARGLARPTGRLETGAPINDDSALEREADVMGARAAWGSPGGEPPMAPEPRGVHAPVVQRKIDKAALNAAVVAAQGNPAKFGVIDAAVTAAYQRLQTRLPPDHLVDIDALLQAYRTKPVSSAIAKKAAAKTLVDALISLDETVERGTEATNIGGADFTTALTAGAYVGSLAPRHAQALEAVQTLAPARAAALTAAWQAVQTAVGAPAYNAVATEAAVKDYLALMQTEEFATSPERLMRVGTEFTFTSNDIAPLDIKKGGAPLKAAVTVIDGFVDHVAGSEIWVGGQALAAPVVTREPLNFAAARRDNRAQDDEDQQAAKFTYRLPSGAAWWWKADVDYNCIETQAEPFTREAAEGQTGPDSGAISSIISQHIFGAADAARLRRDDTLGGGHLSIDRTTTFGHNARWLRNYLVIYANEHVSWKREDPDKFNAPMIVELKRAGRDAFKTVIREFDASLNGTRPMSLETLADNLKTRVFKTAHLPDPDEPVERDPRAEQPEHYQATNVEHLADADQSKRRLEMRRFDSQDDLEDLLADMAKLVDLAKRARVDGLVPLRI